MILKTIAALLLSSVILAAAEPLPQMDAVMAETIKPDAKKFKLTTGAEFPGAKGSLKTLKTGVLIQSDFTGGGDYIGVMLDFPNGLNLKNMTFNIRTQFPKLMVELTDSQGQNIYQNVTLSGNADEIQAIRLSKFFDPQNPQNPSFGHWGGSNDGILRPPVKRIRLRWVAVAKPALKVFKTEITDLVIAGDDGTPAGDKVLKIKMDQPHHLVAVPGSAPFRIALAEKIDQKTLSYQVRNYTGTVVGHGLAEVSAQGDSFLLPFPDQIGFYEYVFENHDFVCGVIALPKFEEKRDDFFAIDMPSSVFNLYRNPTLLSSYYSLLNDAGVGNIRERLSWVQLEAKEPQFFNWNMQASDEIRTLASKYNLRVLDVFHSAPAWSGANSARNANGFYPLPRDLVKSADSWKTIGGHWKKIWAGLEVWNEPELAFGAGLPGDQLMALQRVISYEFAQNNISTPIVSGVFTGSTTADEMMQPYLRNGLLADADVMSFHNYGSPEQLEAKIGDYRHSFRNDSKQALPLWITECGKPWRRGTARAAVNDDIISGMCITMKAVEAKACGIAMYFPFILQYYDETVNNFGMVDRNHTPMRSLAAYLVNVRFLSHFRYAGDLKSVSGTKLCRVFTRGKEAVIVAYTGGQGIRAGLPESLKIDRVCGSDGRSLPVSASQTLPDGMFYVFTSSDAVKPFLQADTKAMSLLTQTERYKPVPRIAKPVVFQFDFDRATTSWTLYGYLFNDQTRALFPVVLNNLSAVPMTVKPELVLPAGAKLSGSPPEPVTIPPRSRKSFRFEVDLVAALNRNAQVGIEVRDASGNAEPLNIFVKNWNLEKMTATSDFALSMVPDLFDKLSSDWIKLEDPACWKKWDGGHLPNIRAAFRAGYRPGTIRIQVLVEDQKFSQPFPLHEAWKADSIQLALQTLDKDNQRKTPFSEFTAANVKSGPGIFMNNSETGGKPMALTASKLDFKKVGEKLYCYTIDLDAKELKLPELKPGISFGFALIVNSSEGMQRDGYLYWGDGIGVSKNPREFNMLELK